MTMMLSLPRIVLPLLATTLAVGTFAATLTVVVEGTQGCQGTACTVMFRDTTGWLKPDSAVRIDIVAFDNVPGGNVTFVYADLLAKRYALSVFHDANNDGRLGTNPASIPTESYGFSRDARGRFGPPASNDAAVDVQGDQCVTIHLYWY